ncbi:BCCT family transporter [Brachybacterium sp. JHP9]|uniref:BCCT family transporter n=1 Tax=Brachybacterium equifaecis TaxID=2910770 RepID=A0ABT0QY41_9MICO|nr:BCCT family transporter [Brachybacterium equifaecis]MCL6422581.1 BCCT family transporter [Brachybacterium equifaecis]
MSSTPSPPSTLSKPVFFISGGIVAVAVLLALLLPGPFSTVIGAVNTAVVDAVGWYYVLVVAVFVAFSIIVAVSRLGKIRLGKDDEKPEYGLLSWFSMLFAAGMGIGLVFWGAAEPLTFFAGGDQVPPNAQNLATEARANRAMGQTFLHWGLHAWSIYVVVGLAIAYAVHRRGRPISIRWALEPILGKRTDTWIGDAIDIIAIVGTLFGIATSLGFGVNQIFAGLEHLGIFSADQEWIKVPLILLITAVATLSAASGVDKGIRYLSNTNLALAAVLLVTILILGPTLFLLRDFVSGIGYYLQNFIQLSFQTMPFFGDKGAAWVNGWTVNYWGWWMSWSPFVGVFIARISRGRTVREFIIGVLLVPTLVTMLWFTIMGGTAISQMVLRGLDLRQADGSINADTALFDMFANLPGGAILSGIAIVLVSIFFITSADSGAFVVDMIAHRGDTSPPRITRIFWAVASGVIAAALIGMGLWHGGDTAGMSALQALALLSAAPFSVVMIGMMISVWKELSREVEVIEELELEIRQREYTQRYDHRITEHVESTVQAQVADKLGPAVAAEVEQRLQADGADRA